MFTTSSFVRLSGVQCSPIILYSVHVDQPYAAFTMNIYLSLHGSLVLQTQICPGLQMLISISFDPTSITVTRKMQTMKVITCRADSTPQIDKNSKPNKCRHKTSH